MPERESLIRRLDTLYDDAWDSTARGARAFLDGDPGEMGPHDIAEQLKAALGALFRAVELIARDVDALYGSPNQAP